MSEFRIESAHGQLEQWLWLAKNELGVHETPGPAATARIIEYHAVTSLKATSDEVSWCSSFVCWCLEQAGIRSTASAAAKSYLNWGYELQTPREGCIAVLLRGKNPNQGHVGFWVGEKDDKVCLLGGNQSDKVCEEYFPKSKVKSYRWPWPTDEAPQCLP